MKPGNHPYLGIFCCLLLANIVFLYIWWKFIYDLNNPPDNIKWTSLFLLDFIFYSIWLFLWVFLPIGIFYRERNESSNGFFAAVGAGIGGSVLQSLSGMLVSSFSGLGLILGYWFFTILFSMILAWVFYLLSDIRIIRLPKMSYKLVIAIGSTIFIICGFLLIIIQVSNNPDRSNYTEGIEVIFWSLVFISIASILFVHLSNEIERSH
jgi:hypothetical protein